MARARNIKPAFFDNDELGSLDPLARLLFVGMWTIADYKGEFEWREKRVKAKLLPYDNCDISKLAINLDKSGFIRFYSDGDLIYCKVVNFEAHQNPHKNEREKGSSIPEYSEEMRQVIDLKGLTINRDKSGLKPECSHSDPADSLFLNPDPLNLNPDTCNQEPITNNQNNNGAKAPPKKTGSRLSKDWNLDSEYYNAALTIKPMLTEQQIKTMADAFRDYWIAKTGKDATKLDWLATWRNWVRNQRIPNNYSAGMAVVDGNEKIQYEKIKDAFNETHGKLVGEILEMTLSRQGIIRDRVNECPEKRLNPDWWRKYFGYASECPHLVGLSPPREEGAKPWKASFDWLVNPDNMVKVLEGKYDA